MIGTHKRKPNRLKDCDYSQAGCYFVTICVKDRKQLLGTIVGGAHPGAPSCLLTEIGVKARHHIENIENVYKSVHISCYAIMPDHIHMIIQLENGVPEQGGGTPGCASPTKSTLAKVVNALKSLLSRQYGESMWQRSYYDHIIRTEDEYIKIAEYIKYNPLAWHENFFMPIYTNE